MYNNWQLLQRWWQHYQKAAHSKGHGTHSPFVFAFIEQVLNNKGQRHAPTAIEQLRRSLLKDASVIPIVELGAGSRTQNSLEKKVSQIAKTAVKPRRWGTMLYRLAQWQGPKTILELGTSLGISTAYFATACPQARVVTIEGSPAVHRIAVHNFTALGLDNIQAYEGSFDDVLPQVLPGLCPVDLAYVDGNHRYEATRNYFHQLLSCKTEASVFIFDDIHWSKGMEQAWDEIKAHPDVRCTIDLFFMGFVFFRTSFKVPQHFSIRMPLLP